MLLSVFYLLVTGKLGEMEGLYLSDEGYELCRQYSNNEITWNEFLTKALELVNTQD